MTTPEVPYTTAELHQQHGALVREIPAWLVANAPHNPSRRRVAVREIRRITQQGYVSDDLDDDVAWVLTQDLGLRLPIVAHLPDGVRRGLIELAATVASVGSGLSSSDAQFVELLGSGLELDADEVAGIVMSAVQNESSRAA